MKGKEIVLMTMIFNKIQKIQMAQLFGFFVSREDKSLEVSFFAG